MKEFQPPFGFELPQRRPATGEGVTSGTPARLITWLNGAATDDPTEEAGRLLDAVRIMNRTLIGYGELSELTGLLQARAQPILGLLEAQLRDVPLPLEGDAKAQARTHAELLQELAASHLRLVEEGSEQDRMAATEIGSHLRRALLLTGRLCLHRWRLYELEPEGTWLRIHRILAAAEQVGVVSDPGAESEDGQAFVPDSIERVVARISVLAASHVWSLHPGELELLAHWIQSVPVQCTDVTAAPAAVPETASGLWMSLAADQPPSLILGAPPRDDASARHVDLRPVLAALRAAPPEVQRTLPQGIPPLDRRLRKWWSVPLGNRFNEGPAHAGPLAVITGLSASHDLIRADIKCKRSAGGMSSNLMPGGFFAASLDDPLGIPEIFKAGLNYRESHDAMSFGRETSLVLREVEYLSPRRLQHFIETWGGALSDADTQPEGEAEPIAGENARPTCAWLKNVGAGQVSLLLQAPTQRLFSGSLIAIRMANEEKILWKLGVIRWLHFGDDGNVSLGAEYLADACWPTQVRLIDYETPVDVVHPGLFFRDRGRPEVGVLLFAPHTFDLGTRVGFDLFGQEHSVTLKTIRSASHMLSLGEFPNPLRAR